MDFRYATQRLKQLIGQRNASFGILTLSLGINFVQALERLSVQEKIVVLPPQLHQEVWFQGSDVSDSLLEEWGLFFAGLLLNTSPSNIDFNVGIVLKHTDPESYQNLKLSFLNDKKEMEKNNTTTVFQVQKVDVNPKSLICQIHGLLSTFVGKERITQEEHTYEATFRVLSGGKVLLQHFKRIQEAKDA